MSDAARMVARLRTEKPTGPLMVAAAALIEREAARLAEAEREQDTLLAMIRHQRDVLRECLPYINESMAGRRPGRSADDIRAAVKALTADSTNTGETLGSAYGRPSYGDGGCSPSGSTPDSSTTNSATGQENEHGV